MKLNSTLQLKVLENTYTVEFPDNGQYLRIQNMKIVISPAYDSLRSVGDQGGYAELLTDMEAHFSVLCPDLIKSLGKPIPKLSMTEGRELVKAYTEQFEPWYQEQLGIVFEVNKEVDKS